MMSRVLKINWVPGAGSSFTFLIEKCDHTMIFRTGITYNFFLYQFLFCVKVPSFQSPILPPSYRINSSSSCPPPPKTPSSPYTADDDARSPYAVPPSPLTFFRSRRQNERGGKELSTCPVFPRKKSFRTPEDCLKVSNHPQLREFVGNVLRDFIKNWNN